MKIVDQGIFILEISNDTACMNFNPQNRKYSKQLIDSSFQRELRILNKIQNYKWAPEITVIQESDRKIFFKWYNNTCENQLPINWKYQLEQIVQDLHREKIYKPNFYPKCFYTDSQDLIHSYIFYSSSEYDEQPIDIDFYKPILNPDRLKTVEKISIEGKVDMKLLIEQAFKDYIVWPDHALQDIYEKVYG